MFKFGFCDPVADNQPSSGVERDEDSLQWVDAEEIPLFKTPFQSKCDSPANMVLCGNFEIGYVSVPVDKLKANDLLKEVEKSHSDLLPAKYEGGLKVWECTQDIGEFLDESGLCDDGRLAGKRVLDMGCGGGILGIIALECGALVDFQDYNKEVIELFTIPNVCLNAEDEEKQICTEKCKFYSGDWEKFSKLIGGEKKYDFIFTSETIYNPTNYKKLGDFFLKHLADDGYVLLGAKGYYFGVGGSVTEFKKCLSQNYSGLDCETVWTNETGVKREILKIKLKK